MRRSEDLLSEPDKRLSFTTLRVAAVSEENFGSTVPTMIDLCSIIVFDDAVSWVRH